MKIRNYTIIAFIIVLFVSYSQAQTKSGNDAEYTKVITNRADKIVATLGIADTVKYTKVRSIITEQYRAINTHHELLEQELKAVKKNNANNKALVDSKVVKANKVADNKLRKLHGAYLKKLSKELSAEQIDKVKDGMTYGVLPITYNGYQEMLPNLTDTQKKQILDYLTEAREYAMDAPSSKQKHAWFGKYKGKINNYLSAQGVDLNKASKEWQNRIKGKQVKNSQR